jgi:hypothetical protein
LNLFGLRAVREDWVVRACLIVPYFKNSGLSQLMGHANVLVWRGFYRFWGLTGILVGWNSSSERGSLRGGFVAPHLGGVLSTVLHYASTGHLVVDLSWDVVL